MPANRKWWFLPPIMALVIVLGPLSMQTRDSGKDGARPASTQPAGDAPTAPTGRPSNAGEATRTPATPTAPTPPRLPDLWQVGTTLLAVLLLGGGGLVVLRRLQRGVRTNGTGIVTVRQSLRLGARQALHVVEFDGRLLLVGETERGVQLLHRGAVPTDTLEAVAADPLLDAPRPGNGVDADDEGAVPKNLVLPRPRRTAVARALPTPARSEPQKPATLRSPLGDFRALLAKVGR